MLRLAEILAVIDEELRLAHGRSTSGRSPMFDGWRSGAYAGATEALREVRWKLEAKAARSAQKTTTTGGVL